MSQPSRRRRRSTVLIQARYTLTYTPSHDRILPTPAQLFVKIKNSSAIPLRAAYLHGPYTLYAACYPATFDPNTKHDKSNIFGNPQFEPNIKAGSNWNAQLRIPESIRETTSNIPGNAPEDGGAPSATWIIEVSSQILFSATATVHYEIIVGRDEKSTDFGFAGLIGTPHSVPGQLSDHQQSRRHKTHQNAQAKGIFSRAVAVTVDDTASLWNKPKLPYWNHDGIETSPPPQNRMLAETDPHLLVPEHGPGASHQFRGEERHRNKRRKKVHLVVITHGLHGNLGADMLYLKESIDAAAKQARLDAKMRKAQEKASSATGNTSRPSTSGINPAGPSNDTKPVNNPVTDTQDDIKDMEDEEDDEEVIVRGFPGNAARTERGIQYLGKRLAKYVLSMTYPDQPYMPVKKASPLVKAFSSNSSATSNRQPSHHGSSINKEEVPTSNLAYRISSISFIGHSLGGLTQTYAIAYIHKHSPEFFERIKPINFIALASPLLGLSNENPIYVKFALDFGLVGRTGQDLGLTWRPPTMVRSGWGAMIAGIGTEGQKQRRQLDPGSKPLLRILPAGPAHQVLRMFRNRTVYSNVVNDGVVPLRTSCLLFLDWRGLGRVEKARRENGLVGSMANWGWAEITGTNVTEHQKFKLWFDSDQFASSEASGDEGATTPRTRASGAKVPQPAEDATQNDEGVAEPDGPEAQRFLRPLGKQYQDEAYDRPREQSLASSQPTSPLAGFMNLFKPSSKSHHHEPKGKRIYKRGQTVKIQDEDATGTDDDSLVSPKVPRPGMARGESALNDHENVFAPPTTSIFESAGDILNPPIPSNEYLTDPTSRPRTIFHDRVYHPDDIPPPPAKKRSILRRNVSGDGRDQIPSQSSSVSVESGSSVASAESGSMKVEEKIARAYHRELSWRKVLVRLEPDAHNNIVVRRMFANAYGWPVVKHLVDTHFSDSYSAKTADTQEPNTERAQPMSEPAGEHGEEVKERPQPRRASTGNFSSEARDDVTELSSGVSSKHSMSQRPRISRIDSAQWDDRFFNSESDDDEDEFEPERSPKPVNRVPRIEKQDDTPSDGSSAVKSSGKKPDMGIDTNKATKAMVAPVLTNSPTSTSPVGLRKSFEEQLDTVTQARKADQEKRKSSQQDRP